MLLVVDVGNTNITYGVFEEGRLKTTFRMTTKQPRTSDEFGFLICGMMGQKGISTECIKDVIIGSVVPDIMYSLTSGIIKYLNITPLVVGPGIKTGIKLLCDNPKEIGADRIVDAVAAYEMYGGPILVVDFGTATTFDLITEEGAFVAGITSPGIEISAKALWQDAAKLPRIEIVKPKSILAKETITSMQAGLVYGYIGLVEYIIEKVKEESGIDCLKVVATGGMGKLLAVEVDAIHVYDSELTLKGLEILYNKNKGK